MGSPAWADFRLLLAWRPQGTAYTVAENLKNEYTRDLPLEVTVLLLSQIYPVSKKEDMEIASQWEEYQSHSVRSQNGQYVLTIF